MFKLVSIPYLQHLINVLFIYEKYLTFFDRNIFFFIYKPALNLFPKQEFEHVVQAHGFLELVLKFPMRRNVTERTSKTQASGETWSKMEHLLIIH